MLVTLSGIVMLVSDAQPKNAYFPILVTLSGIVMLSSDVQIENVLLPMLVTLPSVGIALVLQPKTSVLLVVSIRQFPLL